MALRAPIDLQLQGGFRRKLPLKASADPHYGSLLSYDSSGYVHELVAGERYAGVCLTDVVSGGYTLNGQGSVEAMTGSFLLTWPRAISGIDISDAASATLIYATADDAVTETPGTNTKIGCVAGLDADGIRPVLMCATAEVAAAGTTDGTIKAGAITGAAIVGDSFASTDVTLRLANDVCIMQAAGAPTDTVTGAAITGIGSLYLDRTNGIAYINTGTKASPTWTKIGTQS